MISNRIGTVSTISLLMLGIVPAAAHPILIHYGTVEWSGNKLYVSIPLDNHCLDHERRAAGEHVTAEQLAQSLVNSIHAYSHQQGEVPTFVTRIDEEKKLATKVFTLPPETDVIAVIHKPEYDLPPLSRQIQLVREPATGHRTEVVRLTSGGNSAVLHKDNDANQRYGFNPFTEPVLYVFHPAEGRDVAAIVDYPCRLLSTWPGLLGLDDETVSVETFLEHREGIATWASQRCLSAGGISWDRRILSADVELIGPHGESLSGNADHRYCIYTTRIRIKLFSALSEASQRMTIRWTGFNGAILRIPVVMGQGNEAVVSGILTPLQDTVEYSNADTSQVTVRQMSEE